VRGQQRNNIRRYTATPAIAVVEDGGISNYNKKAEYYIVTIDTQQ
jgi:hypothetical protein